MTENNYVIKEDPSKAGLMLGQRRYTVLSLAVTHSGEGPQERRDIDHVLAQCWPIVSDAGPTLKQHKGNVSL